MCELNHSSALTGDNAMKALSLVLPDLIGPPPDLKGSCFDPGVNQHFSSTSISIVNEHRVFLNQLNPGVCSVEIDTHILSSSLTINYVLLPPPTFLRHPILLHIA